MTLLRLTLIIFSGSAGVIAAYFLIRWLRLRLTDPEWRTRAKRTRQLKASHRNALRRLAEIEAGEGGRYRIPWCLVLGAGKSDHRRLIAAAALRHALPLDVPSEAEGLNWYFFERGVAIDLPSRKEEDDGGEWRTVLKQVRNARPDRPIDAVTVAIPASDLFGETKLSLEDTRQRAEDLYKQLAEVQRILRVRFPVYVIVTECEVLRGFTSFYHAVPEILRDDMFGWSSPHSPDETYEPGWLPEAFDSICEANVGAQLEIFAGTQIGLEEREKVLLLNDDIRTLSERLSIFLDQFLRTSVYHEAMMLRGIYLTGNDANVGGDFAEAGKLDAARAPARPVFLTEVFDHRVFAELGLATPTFIGIRSRRRIIAGLQITCGILAITTPLGLWLSWDSLSHDAAVVKDAIDAVDRDAVQIANAGPKAWPPDAGYFAGYAEHLSAAIADMNERQLFYLRLPGSWISSLRRDLQQELGTAFARIELAAIGRSLLDRTTFLIPMTSPTGRAGAPRAADTTAAAAAAQSDGTWSGRWPLASPIDTDEFIELSRFADDLSLLDTNVKAYNSLSDDNTDTAVLLNRLSLYLYGIDQGGRLTDPRVKGAVTRMTREAELSKITPPTRVAAEQQANLLIDRLRDRLYKLDPVYLEMKQLVAELEELTEHGVLQDYSPEDMVKPLYQLSSNMEQLIADLKAPEEAWLAGTRLDLKKPYATLEEELRTSKLFGPDVFAHLRAEVSDYFPNFRDELHRLETRATGPLLKPLSARDTIRRLKDATADATSAPPRSLDASAGLEGLGLQLKAVLSESYMGREPPPERENVTSGCAPLPDRTAPALGYLWDKARLQEALGLAQKYDFLVRDHLNDADEGRRPLLDLFQRSALSRVHRHMRYIVENAHRQLPAKIDEDMQLELDSLAEVRETLGQIRGAYARLSATGLPETISSGEELTRFLRAEGYSLLARLTNRLLGGGEERGYRLYGSAADKVAQWDWAPGTSPAVVAFGPDLKPYLDKQRSLIQELSKKAASALQILELAPAGNCDVPDEVEAWSNIKTQLELHERLTPGNSVQKLERYVLEDLGSLTLENCLEVLPHTPQQRQDYFLDRLSDLNALMRSSCDRRVAQRIESDYLKLFHDFNESLSDRYPFSGKAEESERNVPADMLHIRAFLEELDRFRPLWMSYLKSHAGETGIDHLLGGGFRYVRAFITHMTAVKTFFTAFVSDPTTDNYVCEVATEFRVNRRQEVNADQIAEWWVEVNGRRLDASRFQWHVGDRMRVLFRWAKNSLMVPATEQKVRWAQAEKDSTVAFAFEGEWSLIELLDRHQPGAVVGSADSAGSTLRFDVELQPRRAAMEGNRSRITGKATVFLRFAVSAPRAKQTVPFPVVFPRQAPSLSGTVVSQ